MRVRSVSAAFATFAPLPPVRCRDTGGNCALKALKALAHPTAVFLQNHSGPIYLGDALKDSPDVSVHWGCW